jgi:hypothetical protein
MILAAVLAVSGCATLQHPSQSLGRSAIEQELRWQAAEESSKKIALISNTTEELQEKLSCREDELGRRGGYRRSAAVVRKEIEEITQRLGMMGAVEHSLKKLMLSKVYVNINCEPGRQYIYRYLVEKSLKVKCVKVADNENEADYVLRVVIKKDGVDQETRNYFYLFKSDTLKATSSMDVVLTDRKKNIIVYEDTVEGIARHENSYLLGVGPLSNASNLTDR